jgi:hypothetical protein
MGTVPFLERAKAGHLVVGEPQRADGHVRHQVIRITGAGDGQHMRTAVWTQTTGAMAWACARCSAETLETPRWRISPASRSSASAPK